MSEEPVEMDITTLNKYSRQNATFGAETTAKLIKMKVIIFGLRGIGAETAKNLALQGVGSMTLVDPSPVTVNDLGVNFFFVEDDIRAGLTRADAFASKLRELNPICDVKVASEVSEALICHHTALVVTNSSVSKGDLIRMNEICRKIGKSFLYAFTGGFHSSVFVDHGDAHVINDADGEKPQQKLISNISPTENPNEFLIRYDTPEGQPAIAIDTGSFKVSDISGCPELNGRIVSVNHPWKDPVKTLRAVFEGVSSLGSYASGGLLTEEKVPRAYPMASLSEKIKNPGSPFNGDMVQCDLLTFSEQQVHVAFIATLAFAEKEQRLPTAADLSAVLDEAKNLLSSKEIQLDDFELNEDIVAKVSAHSGFELQPMAAFIGGVLGQEVVKCTGKFTPIPGWFHFQSFETLPDEKPIDTAPRNHRYDNLAAVFGWKFVEKLGDLNYFLVGCGALGCEFLKNFAMNGICCGPNGKLTVTDADRIKLSNLTRQFLFREINVGQPKSRAGCAMAVKMNKDLKVNALEQFVGKNTENIFNDEFWMGLSGVCNALDNMEARQYVDVQCVKYEKSLLESGTMGTSGNIYTIRPFHTKTYRDGGNAAQTGGVPMRKFPHLTDHCIEWARDQFELLFVKLPKGASKYVENPAAFESDKRTLSDAEPLQAIFEIRCVIAMMKAGKNPTLGTAAQLAFELFHMLFRDKILDLQAAFPQDSRMKEPKTGNDLGPFWSEKKRYPSVALFNPDDEAHWNFIASTTCLFGVILGIFPARQEGDDSWLRDFRNASWVKSLVPNLDVPSYLRSPVKIEGDDSAAADSSKEQIIESLLADLKSYADGITLPALETIDFEKDDDLNFHIAFVTSASNLRCDNYTITRTDFHSCKVIAGKIIAAIATTTAAVCGLVVLELFKVQQGKGTNELMLRQIGLAVNNFTSFTQDPPRKFSSCIERIEPVPESESLGGLDAYDEKGKIKEEFVEKNVQKAYPEGHSTWDKIECDGSMSLSKFIEWFKVEHGVIVTAWNMFVGYTSDHSPKTVKVFPTKPPLDFSILPSLDLKLPDAMKAINSVYRVNNLEYINIWRKCKADGAIPSASTGSDSNAITADMTLKEILLKMESLGTELEEKGSICFVRVLSYVTLILNLSTVGEIVQKNMIHIGERIFFLIPGEETPFCETLDGESIKFLASIKIMLR